MASVGYSEAQAHNNDRRPLSLCVDAPPSSSPFPSPSSSFLPPPMPGAHEFAVKPPPAGRASRKASVPKEDEADAGTSLKPPAPQANGAPQFAEAMTPTTPTPSAFQRQPVATTNGHGNGNGSLHSLPSSPLATTPTAYSTTLPNIPQQRKSASLMPGTPTTPITPSSPSFHVPPSPTVSLSTGTGNGNGIALDTSPSSLSLTSNRPAPPSPAVSRRASAAPSTSSARSKSSRSSRPPSAAVSRNNSTRKPHTGAGSASSPTTNRLSTQLQHYAPSPSPSSPHAPFSFVPPSTGAAPASVSSTPRRPAHAYIKIRDFAFAGGDERHAGLGAHVPRANRVPRLNRALRGNRARDRGSVSSFESSGDEDTEEEDEGGWMGFKSGIERFMGLGAGLGRGSGSRSSAGGSREGSGSGSGSFPSQMELARNFLGDEEDEDGEGEDEFFDAEGEGEGGDEGVEGEDEEEPLYPGLYRALYAFEPEGTAEMALAEDQYVRVVGRGGGVGWAVVVDEREGAGDKHALVPESYLEVVKLDWEDEDEGADTGA